MSDKPQCAQHAAHEQRFITVENDILGLKGNHSDLMNGLGDIRERVTAAEQSTRSAHHRLDTMEEQTEAVIRLAVSVEHIANQNQEILKEMKSQREEIIALKSKPSEVDAEKVESMSNALTLLTERVQTVERKDGEKAEKLLTQIKWLLITLTGGSVFALVWNQLIK